MKTLLPFLLFLLCASVSSAQDGLTVTSNNELLLNTDTQIGSADVTFKSNNNTGFGGMYIESPDASTGQPFYGYVLDGIIESFHYFDANDSKWKLSLAGTTNAIEIDQSNNVMINTNTPINSFTDLTLRTGQDNFGGMYIDSQDAATGQPFYGYALDGTEAAYHYFDAADNRWKLSVDGTTSAFEIDQLNNVMINTDSPINSFTDLTLRTSQDTFGGMYIDSQDAATGQPFYGYAVDGIETAYHYFDAADNRWKVYTGKADFTDSFEIDGQGNFYLNTDTAINSFTDLTLRATQDSFGGMYIDSPDNNTGKPFYGYAVGGIDYAFHYYDIEDSRWKLYSGKTDGSNSIEVGADNLVRFEDKIQLGVKTNEASDPNGTILFTGNGFWGKRGGNWYRLDATSSSTPFRTTELEQENSALKDRVEELEERIARLESLITD